MKLKGFFLLHLPKKMLLAAAAALALAAAAGGIVLGGAQMVGARQQSVQIPIVMYHHILDDSRLLGDYVISPEQFESDLKYIRQQGYSTVLPREAAAWARGEGELPEKPLMITFDDGNKSALIYAYPLLRQYGMKGALAVIGVHSEKYSENGDSNVQYAHATWDDLREMEESGVIEIGSHTYNLHEEQNPRRGTLRRKGESLRDYQAALEEDLIKNQTLLSAALGHEPRFFAYPYGFIDPDADAVMEKLGFDVTLGVEEKVPTVTRGDMASLKKLGRFNRPYSASTGNFFDKIFAQVRSDSEKKRQDPSIIKDKEE